MGSPTFIPSSDGVRVALHDLGGPDDPSATVLLFAHATGLCGRVWEPVATSLAPRFRCLAIDFRGHGMSEMPPGARVAWPQMGDDVDAVLQSDLVAPSASVHGIGHSMGGAALVLAASGRPGPFRSLWLYEPVIVGPGVLPPMDAPNPMADAAARRKSSFGSFEEAISNFAAKPPLNQLHPDALEAYVRGGFVEAVDGRVTLRCAPATEAAVFRGAADSGAYDQLTSLDVPVAVVAGRNEDAGPVAFVPAALAQLEHGTFVDRPQLGHFGPLEDPSGAARDVTAWIEATDDGRRGAPS